VSVAPTNTTLSDVQHNNSQAKSEPQRRKRLLPARVRAPLCRQPEPCKPAPAETVRSADCTPTRAKLASIRR